MHIAADPMYVLPVKNFLELTAWAPHQELLKSGKLRQFSEDMRGRVLFCSHQWCSYVHPDPGGDQLEALQGVIQKLAAGKMAPRGNGVVEHGFGLKMGRTAKEWVDLFQDAYIWFGACCCARAVLARPALSHASLLSLLAADPTDIAALSPRRLCVDAPAPRGQVCPHRRQWQRVVPGASHGRPPRRDRR